MSKTLLKNIGTIVSGNIRQPLIAGNAIFIEDGIIAQIGKLEELPDLEADVVINCGDAGTEGELIQRWVINQCNYKGKVQRLWISSLTTNQSFNKLFLL